MPIKSRIYTSARQLLFILGGNTVYALGVVLFLLPNGLITGGTTGLALSADYYFHVPISAFVFVFNMIMLLLGWIFLGKKFALTTIISSFYYPFILEILQRIPALSRLETDTMLATVFGGILIGIGIGAVIRVGASTGGMDIPPLILKKKTGFPVSVSLYLLDFVILLLQMTFRDPSAVLYGILLILTYTIVLDKCLVLGQSKTRVEIISSKYEAINQAISGQLDRGSTLIYSRTGYLENDLPMVMTVISDRELAALNQLVRDIDPKAFMIISSVNEVHGRGFTSEKVYREKAVGSPEGASF